MCLALGNIIISMQTLQGLTVYYHKYINENIHAINIHNLCLI